MESPKDVPVLVTAFRRPRLLGIVINALRRWQPKYVYFAVDGPRSDDPRECALVKECQHLVADFDWTTDVKTLFQPANLGVGAAMATAITWFFDHVESGMIIEDDVIPSPAFADFVYRHLTEFRTNPEIISLSGSSWLPDSLQLSAGTYRYSRFPQAWGWATWRDRWMEFEADISDWRVHLPPSKRWEIFGTDVLSNLMWARNFDRVVRGSVDTWDYQFVYLALRTSRFTVFPRVALTSNLGFGADATHTFVKPPISPATGLAPAVWTPMSPIYDRRLDRWTLKNAYGYSSLGIARKLVDRFTRQ